MLNTKQIVGITIVGFCVVGTCEAIKLAVQVVKTKKALKGIKEQLDVVDTLIDNAKEIKLQEEEIH